MFSQQLDLGGGRVLDVRITPKGDSVTVSQQIVVNGVRPQSKQCTVTCHATGKSYSWSCADDKDCEGDCSDPNNPKGRCY